MHKSKVNPLINFRADPETLEAIDKLVAAHPVQPGTLAGGERSRAIRAAILAAASRLDAQGGER